MAEWSSEACNFRGARGGPKGLQIDQAVPEASNCTSGRIFFKRLAVGAADPKFATKLQALVDEYENEAARAKLGVETPAVPREIRSCMARRSIAPRRENSQLSDHSVDRLFERTTSIRRMATQYVPGDIRDFILKHIASVAQIEALLLIWSNPEKRWGVPEIAARIYASEAETAKALEGLCADGLVVCKNGVFRLNASEENVEMIGRLKEVYARHLIPVTDIIHGKSRNSRSDGRSAAFKRIDEVPVSACSRLPGDGASFAPKRSFAQGRRPRPCF